MGEPGITVGYRDERWFLFLLELASNAGFKLK